MTPLVSWLGMLDVPLAVSIAVPLGTLALGKYLDRWLTKKPKLISWVGHTSAFTLRGEKPLVLHTHAIVIRNAGRLAANNVRIGHNILPENYQVYPSVSHTVERHDDGTAEIVLPLLVPEEQISISYLYQPPILWHQINSYTKSDEGFAKVVSVLPTPQLSRWTIRGIWALIFVGVAALLYLLIQLILWIAH